MEKKTVFLSKKNKLFLVALLLWGLSISPMVTQPAEVSGWDIYREKMEFELLTLVGDGAGFIAGSLMKSYLAAIGIKVTHIHQESAVMYPKIQETWGYYENATAYDLGADPMDTIRPYDLIYMALSSSPTTPTDMYSLCHSGNDYPGGDNDMGFHNTTMDDAIDLSANSTMDIVPFYINKQQEIASEEVPYVHVLYQKDVMPVRKGIDGLIYSPNGLISWDNPMTTLNFHNTSNMPAARDGKEFVMRYFKFVRDGNPDGMLYYEITTGRTAYVDGLMWEPMVITNETGQYVPWLAESYSISTDGLTFNFTLRDGIKWHDFATEGKYVTPEDVKFSYDYIKNAEGTALYSPVTDVESCTVLADGTIQFVMSELDSWAISYIWTELKIFPKHIFETVPYNDPTWHDLTNMTTKIGSGAFKFEKVDPQSPPTWWQFVRNEDYWFTGDHTNLMTSLEPTVAAGGSIPYYPRMDRFTVRVITGTDATVAAIRDGSADVTRYMWAEITTAAQEYPDQIDFVSAPSIWRKLIHINNNIFPLSDKRVRQAIAYAIDYDAIVEASEGGNAIALYNNYLPESYYGAWHNPASDVYDYNPARAYAILEDAGYLDTDGDGVRETGWVPEITTTTETTTTTTTETTTTTTTETTTTGDGGAGFTVVEMLLLSLGSFLVLAILQRKRKR